MKTNLAVFQQKGSAESKIAGIDDFGQDIKITHLVSIDEFIPELIDDPEEYISKDFHADLILNYFKHPDLSDYLMKIAVEKNIPIISAGKKGEGYTPFTCCGLGKHDCLGSYGKQFGLPEYNVETENGKIKSIEVKRGAPCGATWDALEELVGCTLDEAYSKLPRQVQYYCTADPSRWDPVTEKSPVHYAGYVHLAALKLAIKVSIQRKKRLACRLP